MNCITYVEVRTVYGKALLLQVYVKTVDINKSKWIKAVSYERRPGYVCKSLDVATDIGRVKLNRTVNVKTIPLECRV